MCNPFSHPGLQGRYFEAAVTGIDPAKQSLTANFPKHAGLEQYDFEVPYDILVYSVGSIVNTFGIEVRQVDARLNLCMLLSCYLPSVLLDCMLVRHACLGFGASPIGP